jgi:hypothetical protein
MKELWERTFELFRRQIALSVPCSLAGIIMLTLDRLEKAWIHWLVGFFGTQHSVLGAAAPVADWAEVQRRAMMVVVPVGLLKQFLEVCLFVVALVATKNLVGSVLDEQRPDTAAALRGIVPRSREVLLFSLKYMAVMGVSRGVLMVMASSLRPYRFREFVSSTVLLHVFGFVAEGCLAWLLLPAAIRLLRPPGGSAISTQGRRMGTIFTVAASVGSLALNYLVGKAENPLMLENHWEGFGIAAVNTVIVNLPEVLLFIALALMAIRGVEEDALPAAEPEMSLGSRLADLVRRAREWRGDSL